MTATKICSSCKLEKPTSAFPPDRSRRDGLYTACTLCRRERNKQLREQRKARILPVVTESVCRDCGLTKPSGNFARDSARANGLYLYCRSCQHQRYKKWLGDPKERTSYFEAARVKFHYGLTPAEHAGMFTAQQGLCAICGQPETTIHLGKLRKLCVDHDHATGKIRELLCNNCNQGIAKFREDVAYMEKAIAYLRRHGR